MITRQDIVKRTGVSLATVRRILAALDVPVSDIKINQKGCPVYLYQNQIADIVQQYIEQANKRKLVYHKGLKRCRGGCNRYLEPQQLSGSQICQQCRLRKQLNNLAYDKQPWLHKLNVPVVQKAITFLQNLLKKSEK